MMDMKEERRQTEVKTKIRAGANGETAPVRDP